MGKAINHEFRLGVRTTYFRSLTIAWLTAPSVHAFAFPRMWEVLAAGRKSAPLGPQAKRSVREAS